MSFSPPKKRAHFGASGKLGSVPMASEVPATRPQADQDTFAEFYEENVDWARRLAYVLLPEHDVSEDLAQDAFLAMRDRFARLDNPRAYLRVALVNSCRRHRRRVAAIAVAQQKQSRGAAELGGSVEILSLLDALPERQRVVLILRYFEDLSEQSIASILRCRPGTVKSLAARGLERLRTELAAQP